jgi:EpsI family protein
MKNRSARFAVAVFAMMAVTLIVIAFDRPPAADVSLPVSLPLPDSVGASKGVVPMFCQNPDCLADVTDRVTGDGRCPKCGAEVGRISPGERSILPPDTVIDRKRYTGPAGAHTVTVVVSGAEQKSIHRPQQCLPAQGFTITSRGVISVERAGNPPLRLTRLQVRHAASPGGRGAAYAYWFTDGVAETPFHLSRLAKMAADRILRKRAPRWAYVAVSTDVVSSTDDADSRIVRFVGELYPSIAGAPSPR